MFFQKILYDLSFNDLQQRLLDEIQQPRQLNLQRRFSIHEFHAGIQQVSHIVNASPYFRYASVYAEQAIYGFHRGTDGILGVKIVSLGVSANWPRKAKLVQPSGMTSGRSPLARGMKKAVM